ncbi:MAG: hypothetical protein EHM93_13065 [Bacteroidales bacterium]|nr:MAG: hypothetical protein EHM93_13065 [Bacteroidales bacterium]
MKKFALLILFMTIAFQIYAIDGLLVKTIDYSFKEKWDNTVGSSIPAISTCDTVFKKQYFFITVVAADYASDNQDISNVQYSIKIIKPDNSVYFSQENLPVVNGKISNKSNLQMSDAILKVCFENNDAFGEYKIEIEIIDKVSSKSKSISSDIILAALPSYKQVQVKDDDAFSIWFLKYYENPRPERALAYYLYYSQSKLSDKESSFWPVFSIFLEIAKNNSFLLPQIVDCYKNQDLKTKIYLLYLLTYSDIGTNDFFDKLEGDEKDTYKKIKESPLIDIYGTISDPSQLDMLWGAFMASGSYKSILKLIQTLEYTKYQGYLDKFKKSKQTPEDRQNAINNAIYNSLVWSLKSNCKQHKLVKEYCDWALNYENLSDVQKTELKDILK